MLAHTITPKPSWVTVHNVDISKPLTHITPYTVSAICPEELKADSSVKSTLL
jgi:hypothetical protein